MIDQYGELAVLQDENAALRHRITELELLHSEQFARARLEQQSGSALPDCEADWRISWAGYSGQYIREYIARISDHQYSNASG